MANRVHPAEWTHENIRVMREELRLIGLSYDWDREIATCDADYYRHEQKMFLDFLREGLAYRRESWVNWDPVEHTVLANEQVIDGRGWRSNAPVEKRQLTQWFLRITEYADELLDALPDLGRWPETGARHAGALDRTVHGRSDALYLKGERSGRIRRRGRRSRKPDGARRPLGSVHDASRHDFRGVLLRHLTGPPPGGRAGPQ